MSEAPQARHGDLCAGQLSLGLLHQADPPADQLQIAPSAHRITLLHPPGYDYFRLLRSKLHWGRGGADFQR